MLTKAPARPTSFGIERHRAIVEGGERRLDLAEPLIDLLGDLISLRIGFLEAVHLRLEGVARRPRRRRLSRRRHASLRAAVRTPQHDRPPRPLVGKLAALVGDLRAGPLQIRPDGSPAHHRRRGWSGVSGSSPPSSTPRVHPRRRSWRSELQQSVITSILLANSSNYSTVLLGDPAPAALWQVQLAKQFIEANWDLPKRIEELVRVTNVSARSLFSAFKAGRGYSPMDFVKRVRLGHARQKLSRPDAMTSVTGVAHECGFGNPGHFAMNYRELFCESPSETLKRGRGGGRLECLRLVDFVR